MGSSSIGTRLAHVKSVCACQWWGSRIRFGRCCRRVRAGARASCWLHKFDLPYPYPMGPHTETMQHSALSPYLYMAFPSPKSERSASGAGGRCARSRHTRAVRSASLRPRHADPACGTCVSGAFDTSGRHPAHPHTRPRATLVPRSFPGISGHVSPVPESTPTRHITRPRVFVSCT